MFTGDIQAYPMRDRTAKRHEAQAHWTLCNYCFNEGQMLMQNKKSGNKQSKQRALYKSINFITY